MDLFTATTPRQITRLVIFEGAQIHATDEQGDTALHSAIRRRASLEVMAELVRLGAGVNTPGFQRFTPLVLAVYHPDIRLMEHLMDNGALVDGERVRVKAQRTWAALHAAAYNDLFDQVELLLARGANPNQPGLRGSTPLFAARSGAMVRRLIQAGANPHQKDQAGQTAIERWRTDGRVEALEALQPPKPSRPVLKVVGCPDA